MLNNSYRWQLFFFFLWYLIVLPSYCSAFEIHTLAETTNNIGINSQKNVYYPDDLKEPLFNPGYGLIYPTWKGDGAFLNAVKSYTDIAYNRFTWKQLEPVEGKYRFDVIDKWIKRWKKKALIGFVLG